MAVNFDRERMHEVLKKEECKAINYVKRIGELENVNVETILLEGHPAKELIRYAEQENMDIVVMGTIRKTGLDRLLWVALQERCSGIQKFL